MIDISKMIRLEIQDWLYNSGLVGVANILRENDIHYEVGLNYIEFDSNIMEDFQELYFKYFSNKYKKFTSWYRIVSFQDYIEKMREEGIDLNDIDNINKQIEYMKNKLKSNSYKSGYTILNDKTFNMENEEKKLKKLSIKDLEQLKDKSVEVKEQVETIEQIIDYLNKENVKKIILAKNIIYDVIAKFWSDVSFLNRTSNNKDMYDEYKNYFINPVVDYLELNQSKFKYDCFICDNKLSKLSKPIAYDLTWLNKIGVDMSRKTSHFWNLSGDSYICPICNFVYSCIPAGFTVYGNKGLFINENSNVDSLIAMNRLSLANITSIEELEHESYFNIADTMEQSSIEGSIKEIENIQIIKLNAGNEARPYTFNILSKEILQVINKNKNMLKPLIKARVKIGRKNDRDLYINLYSEVLRRFYSNQNQFDLIYKLFSVNLSKKFNNNTNNSSYGKFDNLIYVDMIIKINNNFLGGAMRDKYVNDKKLFVIRQIGYSMRKAYGGKGALNKVGGISYRLLNALKTGDTDKFMNTLINSYMYLNQEIPTVFIEMLSDKDVFRTIGYAFLLGLQGKDVNSYKENSIGKGN